MHYRNFDLDLFSYEYLGETERFHVRVVQSPAGRQKYSDAETVTLHADLRGQLSELEQQDLDPKDLIDLGRHLADLMLPPRVRSYLSRSLERIAEDEGIRIRLLIDSCALADIPWEYAYIAPPDGGTDEQSTEGFLALDRRFSLVRCETLGESPPRLEPIERPVQVIAVLANPEVPGFPTLDLEAERQSIETALAENEEFNTTFFSQATLSTFEAALTRDCHVFHFAGHGMFQTEPSESPGKLQGKGFLILVAEAGRLEAFPADLLAANLRGRGVRLAVLGTCEGGRRDAVNAWSGIAPALNRTGIPAVVAMQYTISDKNAIAFMRRLYTALAAGQSIDAAVSDGRLAILNRGQEAGQDWGTPVLYLRADERDDQGVLFPVPGPSGTQALVSQLRPGKPGFVALLAAATALLLSLLSGLNQFVGFFGKISLATAVVSVLLAVTVLIAFPTLLRRQFPQGERLLKMSYRLLAVLLAVVILLAGVGPYAIKYAMASTAKSAGTDLIDKRDYAPARVYLERAARYFSDLSLTAQATAARVILTQALAGLGEGDLADALTAELQQSGNLSEPLQGKLYTIQGNLAQDRGHYEQAEHYYQLASGLVTPGSQAQAILLQNQGVLWADKGMPYRARVLQNYEQARQIYQELGDQRGMAQILLNEANLYANEPGRARSIYEQAFTWAETADDPYLMGTCAENIGITYRQEGNLDQAEAMYQLAQEQFEAGADLVGQADVLMSRATLEWVRGRRELARQYLQTAEAYLANVDVKGGPVNPRKLAAIRTFQADIYDLFGELERAAALYEEALAIFSQHPQPLAEAQTQVNYGTLLLRLGANEEARNWFERAREIMDAFSGEGSHELLGVLYNDLGKAYQDLGDLENALKYYRLAEDVFADVGEPLQSAVVKENIGLIYGFQGQTSTAIEAVEQALVTYRQYHNADHEVKALYNLYSLYGAANDPKASQMISAILSVMELNNIDQETEASVLFGILPQDIATDHAMLATYRERLVQLKAFYEERGEPVNLGRALLSLADVEQKLGDTASMVRYARAAEAYVDRIPLPARINSLTNLAFYLWDDDPQSSFDYLLEAFDLAETTGNTQQQSVMAMSVGKLVLDHAEDLESKRCSERVQHIAEVTQSPEIREMFQMIADYLDTFQS